MAEQPTADLLPFPLPRRSPGRRLLGWADRAIGSVPLPGWTTPVAVASLALLVIQSFDHRYARGSIPWTIVLVGALVVLLGSLYTALAADDQRVAALRARPATAALLLILAANTVLHVALI